MVPGRSRGNQIELSCKILALLQTGRWSIKLLALRCGVSQKTIRRYLVVFSLYFVLCEQRQERIGLYWIKSDSFTMKRTRFCKKGHDKLAPHGVYFIKDGSNFRWAVCAQCRRETNKKQYQRRKALNAL
jgi:hypothetical protein